ncbi:hypothetical protein [Deefgea salmonis]|uniref:Cupin domain-containing protein n=1 Tax=Deefgea salmonis TaxID=2875502 RepID=A0ABS8BI80_9NEIS|nr:hypothetical protein [Deefgea salmonis]MCB5195418.1 hypothetical protein [Deefgea salmonis]
MSAVRVLGQITIPESLKQNLGEIRQTRSSAFAAKGVIEVHYFPQGNPNLPTGDAWQLDAEKTAFGIAVLNRLGLAPEYMHDANLMGYAQLDPHTDIGFLVQNEPVAFLHVVLQGEGVLRMTGASNPLEQATAVSEGMVFILNPEIEHAFGDCPDILFSLSMVVPRSKMAELTLV